MLRKIVFMIILLVVVIGSWNYFTLQNKVSQIIKSDDRNNGLSVFLHYEWFVNPNVLIFDLRDVSAHNSSADVTRLLLQVSNKLVDHKYDSVVLAFKGDYRFILKGDFFNITGNEYGSQNPIYTLRNLPQNVYKLDNSPAFSTWSGGMIGVMGKQIEDLNEFHKQWFLSSLIDG